jgi:membrane protease YdiL (CAAX protease family)
MARVSFAAWLQQVGTSMAWLLAFAAVGVGTAIGVDKLIAGVGGARWDLARGGVSWLTGFALATIVVGRRLDGFDWERLGWRSRRTLPRHFFRGLVLGVAMAALAIVLAVGLDHATVRFSNPSGLTDTIVPVVIGLLAAALSEELMFRGYPLRRLTETFGPGTATVLLAVGFAAAHLGNPSVDALSAANIALAALWLAAAFFSTGGMALAWGLHFGWNAGLSLVFDAPVSGYSFDVPGVDYLPGRQSWLDGGRFGPEGGLIGTFVFCAGIAVLLWLELRRQRAPLSEAAA